MRKPLIVAILLAVLIPCAASPGDVEITAFASGTADLPQALAANPSLRLVGFVFTEDAGTPAAARVALYHGACGTGQLIGDWHLAASQTAWEPSFAGGAGIPVPNGVCVDRVTGTTKISLHSKPW